MGLAQYSSDTNSITIKASAHPITAESSAAIDKYRIVSTGTAILGSASATDKDQDMLITSLEGGTVYSLRFKAQFSCTDGPIASIKESSQVSDVYIACTSKSCF